MKVLALLALLSCMAHAQGSPHHRRGLGAGIWKNVPLDPQRGVQGTGVVGLTPARFETIRKILMARAQQDGWCNGDLSDPAWTENLTFAQIPGNSSEHLLLVEAGAGCGRSGQGANGEMWIFRVSRRSTVLIASPQAKFQGWLYSIQKTGSCGLRDLVLAWHMGASDTDFGYFRFDGRSYRLLDAAELVSDKEGSRLIRGKQSANNIYTEQ